MPEPTDKIAHPQPTHLYRFRSVKALLGDWAELDSQHIYFAGADQLNDPMEGFKDLFWLGDNILWTNLLRNYLLGLLYTHYMAGIFGDEFEPKLCESVVHLDAQDLPDAKIRKIYEVVCQKFLKVPVVQQLVTTLAQQRAKVRRDELAFYLRALNPLAVHTVREAILSHGNAAIDNSPEIATALAAASQHLDHLKAVLDQYPSDVGALDMLFQSSAISMLQMSLIQDLNNGDNSPAHTSLMFVFRDFPAFYIRELEGIVYPNWSTACFVADPTDASMWGGYADGHKGICLKFATPPADDGTPTLELYQAIGVSGGRGRETTTIFGYRAMRFDEVEYANEYPEIEFFTSLGNIARDKLVRSWYSDADGKRSPLVADVLAERPEWREAYWENYRRMHLTKMNDWRHEKEYRLVLSTSIEQPQQLKYKFPSLAGICFGIATPDADKLRIMKVIERKCVSEGWFDIEFLQARYSSRTKKIEMAPLTFLKVTA